MNNKLHQNNTYKEYQKAIRVMRFIGACRDSDSKTIEKMIFEEKIEYCDKIKKHLNTEITWLTVKVQEMFDKRELPNKLEKELPHNDAPNKRPKI